MAHDARSALFLPDQYPTSLADVVFVHKMEKIDEEATNARVIKNGLNLVICLITYHSLPLGKPPMTLSICEILIRVSIF